MALKSCASPEPFAFMKIRPTCSAISTRSAAGASRDACSGLWPRQRDVALGAKHIGIEIGDPLPASGRHVEIADFGLDVRRDAVPIELRVAMDDVGRRIIAELAVDADLLELVVQRIGLADVVRIAELPDEICGADDRLLLDRKSTRLNSS